MRLCYLSHRRPAKAQVSLRIRAVSLEPSVFAHMNYGSRRRVRLKIRHLAPLDVCACVFEKWIYRGQKVSKSQELAQINKRNEKRAKMQDNNKIHQLIGQPPKKDNIPYKCSWGISPNNSSKNLDLLLICIGHCVSNAWKARITSHARSWYTWQYFQLECTDFFQQIFPEP